MQHTPGPWHITDDYITGPDDLVIVDFEFNGNSTWNEANARLVAAAPELLEACRMAFEQKNASAHGQRTPHNDIELFNALRSAIAKAESSTLAA